jgi:hypothetical protein
LRADAEFLGNAAVDADHDNHLKNDRYKVQALRLPGLLAVLPAQG